MLPLCYAARKLSKMAKTTEPRESDTGAVVPVTPPRESTEWARIHLRAYVRGYLYITEYNNYGDVQWETPIESATRTKRIGIGTETGKIARETHYVVLFATGKCRVAFVPDGEDIANAESHAFPVAPEVEVPRLIPMNTPMTVVAFPDY